MKRHLQPRARAPLRFGTPSDRSPSKARTVAMLGCAPDSPGGISTVIRLLTGGPWPGTWSIRMLPTWVPGSRARQLAVALNSALRLWWAAVTQDLQAVHVHLAARGSFWRKWCITRPLAWGHIRLIVHVHDGSLPLWFAQQRPWIQRLVRRFLERADAVIALSPRWVERLSAIAPAARLRALGNPVSIPDERSVQQARSRRRQRALAPPSDRTATILFLGRLVPDKGVFTLLEAAAGLQPRHPHWRWVLAGDGDPRAVRQRAKRLGLGSCLELPGWLDEAATQQALSQADVLVLPSRAEGQPLAVLEAMAWSLPVVASAVGDVPDLMAHGAGFTIAPDDAQALMSALEQWQADPDAVDHRGQEGRRWIQAHHAPGRIQFELDRLYRDLGLQPQSGQTADT